jgi:hypothetical protein
VDAGLHLLQGEAGDVTDLTDLLQEFYRDKLTMVLRHEAGARRMTPYDANNVYQYLINRGDVQLSWVARALVDMGAEVPTVAPAGDRPDGVESILREDARDSAAFVERWRPRVDAMTHARHRGMLRVILGETLEQRRAFEQLAEGREDVLGRHNPRNPPPAGRVLDRRWVE